MIWIKNMMRKIYFKEGGIVPADVEFWSIKQESIHINGELVCFTNSMICKPKWVIDMSYEEYLTLITPQMN